MIFALICNPSSCSELHPWRKQPCQISSKRHNRTDPLCTVRIMGQTISSTGNTLQKQVSNMADKVGQLLGHAAVVLLIPCAVVWKA